MPIDRDSPTTETDNGSLQEPLRVAVALSSVPTILFSTHRREVLWANPAAADYVSGFSSDDPRSLCWDRLVSVTEGQREGDQSRTMSFSSTESGRQLRFSLRCVEKTIVAIGEVDSIPPNNTRCGPMDPLTGLGSRVALDACLALALERPHHDWGILFIDLDNYKRVNDQFGHLAGDRVLLEFTQKLQASARPTDAVYRFGGDEFIVVVNQINSIEVLRRVAQRIRNEVVVHVDEGQPLTITATIGCAMAWPELDRPDQIIDRADRDMYRVKGA